MTGASPDEPLPGGCSLVQLPSIADARGDLVALEAGAAVPFAIQRVYYLFNCPPDSVRGHHAHRALQQLAICVSGACTLTLDDGEARRQVRLDRPDTGLHMGAMVWREMAEFTDDCVLLVLASLPYDESDYIRDYDAFLRAVEQGRR